MAQVLEQLRKPLDATLNALAAALLLGLVVVAGERSLAPLVMKGPVDRTLSDQVATDAVYRHVASYATTRDRLPGFSATAERTAEE